MKPIEMVLSENEKIFSIYFSAYAEYTSHFEYFGKKMRLGVYLFLQL